MARLNTIVFCFPAEVERPKAIEVHRFLKTTVNLSPQDVLCIQLDAQVKRFFVKLSSSERCEAIVSRLGGEYPFKLADGSDVIVVARHASGLGRRVVRVFDVPYEAPNTAIDAALSPYGRIVSIQMEKWSFEGYFQCPNGTRQVTIDLEKRHIPSFVIMGEYGKVMTGYEDQPATCALCDERGHSRAACRNKRRTRGWESLPKVAPREQPFSKANAGTRKESEAANSTVLLLKPVNKSRFARGTSSTFRADVTKDSQPAVISDKTSESAPSGGATSGSVTTTPVPTNRSTPTTTVTPTQSTNVPVEAPLNVSTECALGEATQVAPATAARPTEVPGHSKSAETPASSGILGATPKRQAAAEVHSSQSFQPSWVDQIEQEETSNLIQLESPFSLGPAPSTDLKRQREHSRSPSPSSKKQSSVQSGASSDGGDYETS